MYYILFPEWLTFSKFGVLEPDLAYVDVDSSVDSCEALASSQNTCSIRGWKKAICYRFNNPGHLAKGYTVRGSKFCYRCEQDGFTVNTYPQCNQQRKGNRLLE